jgi:hypothetical protein
MLAGGECQKIISQTSGLERAKGARTWKTRLKSVKIGGKKVGAIGSTRDPCYNPTPLKIPHFRASTCHDLICHDWQYQVI